MSTTKRKDNTTDECKPKRVKKDCIHGDKCYRRNPAHFREFSHPHLEAILDAHTGSGPYPIPDKYSMDRFMVIEQLDVIVEKELYTPKRTADERESSGSSNTTQQNTTDTNSNQNLRVKRSSPETRTELNKAEDSRKSPSLDESSKLEGERRLNLEGGRSTQNVQAEGGRSTQNVQAEGGRSTQNVQAGSSQSLNFGQREKSKSPSEINSKRGQKKEPYQPIVEPKRRAEDFLTVVRPRGAMLSKHTAAGPYHMFYTTITAARHTHAQDYSITFLEILDRSLGELKCSLQINFMVDPGWLLAQYYFAGYSEKNLTILYGEECPLLTNIKEKKPHVTAHLVKMATPFGKHHTKMMLLCYEDGSIRVVVSTANLYVDDWENRTQALWLSPRCPPLPAGSTPNQGESPTMFKRSLIKYLQHYTHQTSAVGDYIKTVQKCDFSHINVFLVASVPGSHSDMDWGMLRVATLLRQHCLISANETRQWPLIAQASSLGSYGDKPNLWLTGDFLHNFTKIKDQPQTLTSPPSLKLVYPSLENVKQSHDGLLGGGCLPYAASAHNKQTWLKDYLYQWRAVSTGRDKAMPHIKSYTRISPDNKNAAYFLLTSGNISKAAWGSINKGNGALRVMSYEAGVLFLPKFVINEDFFPLDGNNKLILPYDVPLAKYTAEMSPWVSDYLL